ncbi:unnamed protein product [Malus baccata var. baccata]
MLPIDPTIFSTSHDRGTLVDSGTMLTYLVEEAYDAFVHAINLAISKSANLSVLAGNFSAKVFPPVSLHFAGGASMLLELEEYLLNVSYYNGITTWEMAFHEAHGGYTVPKNLLWEKLIKESTGHNISSIGCRVFFLDDVIRESKSSNARSVPHYVVWKLDPIIS